MTENEKLWTKSSVSQTKLHEAQNPLNDKTGLGFSNDESDSGETSAQSGLVNDKFKIMNFDKASTTYDNLELLKHYDQIRSSDLLDPLIDLIFWMIDILSILERLSLTHTGIIVRLLLALAFYCSRDLKAVLAILSRAEPFLVDLILNFKLIWKCSSELIRFI
ncbi:hypothetical protein F511_14939 [Dorcoceras hygrometricum]|uniref:Uncharacterized protein n=1 Tax=Dorcoceras hygrometricum TaxID=472368 RepID=A0A2Z7DIJ8_9LAMI|nr:hypothetical protein F511_14939 [Dorcoceras hygrometricum]